jgi:hypothetical protein
MSMNGSSTETVEGRVASATERGLSLVGQDRRFSYSQYRQVPHAEPGQLVRLEVDGRGFINRLQVLDGAVDSTSNTRGDIATSVDRQSLRLKVLEIAPSTTVGFASCNDPGKVTSSAILPLAEKLLAWVMEQPARHTIEDLEP